MAYRVEYKNDDYVGSIQKLSIDALPKGDVLIKVKYSSINYKDALSATGNRGVTREYPHTPGIDAAGTVVESKSSKFKKGDKVIVTGYDLGMNTDGGFSEYIRVPKEWPVRLPKGLSLKESMVYGTAGFTAALSVKKLIMNGISQGKVLVTGATGGVGSTVVSILSQIGFDVVAATGKKEKQDFLKRIGAMEVIERKEIDVPKDRLLLSSKWAGVVDTVGGNTLASAIKMTAYDGVVTCCGNIGGDQFISSIYPFILRGVHLVGIYSAKCPRELRLAIWKHLSTDWKITQDDEKIHEISLVQVEDTIQQLLDGTHSGRTIINLEK